MCSVCPLKNLPKPWSVYLILYDILSKSFPVRTFVTEIVKYYGPGRMNNKFVTNPNIKFYNNSINFIKLTGYF